MQSSEEKQLKLINLITEVLDLTNVLEEKSDPNYLKKISNEISEIEVKLKNISERLTAYANIRELKEIKNKFNVLNNQLGSFLSVENEAAQEIFCNLILENLPSNIDSIITPPNKIEMREKNTKKPKLLSTIEVTGSKDITIDIKFENDPQANRRFTLANFKSIFSVIDYINLGIGYGKSIG